MTINQQLTELFKYDRAAVRKVICDLEADYDVVDELMQETFARAWEKREGFDEKAKLLTWVCAIAKNVVRDAVRSKQSQPDLVPEDVLKPVEGGGYTDTLVAAQPQDDPAASLEAEDMLDNIVLDMPVQMAVAVRMRLEGYDNAEIAAQLGTTSATIASQISQSRKYFQQSS
jgi:RNA polymerase sigma factor (sigma-70 family)